jgi:GNAT superfamily N-acetyltransferase
MLTNEAIATDNSNEDFIINEEAEQDEPVLRGIRDGDESLILASWCKSALQYPLWTAEVGSPPIRLPVPPSLLHSQHRSFLKRLISEASILVLSDPEDEAHVMGWICFEEGCLHFIFVKFNFRRMGFGRRLLEGASLGGECEVSHRTPALNFLKSSKWVWNPYRTFYYGKD